MNYRKTVTLLTATVLAASLSACGSAASEEPGGSNNGNGSGDSAVSGASEAGTSAAEEEETGGPGEESEYASIVLGETGIDLDTTIRFLSDRTEIIAADGSFIEFEQYISRFTELYPGIRVEITEAGDEDIISEITDGGDYDLCLIPENTDPALLPGVLTSYGTRETLEGEAKYFNTYMEDGEVYGIPIAADAAGIVYNRKVFEDAGLTDLPRTPAAFIDVLRMVGDKTDAIPFYTNYNEDFAMSFQDVYIGGCATGDYSYLNQKMAVTSEPFAENGEGAGTGPYAVYKILYDAVSKGLTEQDPYGTDFGDSLKMLADGECFSMALGSYTVPMVRGIADDPDTIGFMAFPITVNGTQYAAVLPDAGFGIPAGTDAEHRLAAEIFVKWMTEESGIAADMGALSIAKEDAGVPELLSELESENVVFVEESVKGGELALMNQDTDLYVNDGGCAKIRGIIDNAFTGELMFDQIMESWNDKWTESQKKLGIKVQY